MISARKRRELILRDKVRLIKASADKTRRQQPDDFKIGRIPKHKSVYGYDNNLCRNRDSLRPCLILRIK